MKLSARINALVEGGRNGWEVHYRARELREAGHKVIMLTVGDHDRVTPDALIDAMAASARKGRTGYMPMPGLLHLRQAIAARVSERTGYPAVADNIIVQPGGQASLFAALMTVADPGDRVLFIDPFYATYPGTIRSAGAIPVPVPARPDNGFHPLRADLEAAAAGAVALLINSPNNPTGAVYSPETMRMIAAFCQAHDLWLLSDEVYDGQVWEGRHLSPRGLPGMAERTLVLNSLSKSQVMTGWRIGWVAGPVPAIERMTELAINTTYGIPGFIQDAGAVALTAGKEFEADLRETYRRRRGVAIAALRGANGVSLSDPAGAMYVMLDIRTTGLDGITFAETLLDEVGIAVMPGESFGRAASGHVRVALTVEDGALEEALLRLARFAAERVRT